MQKRTFWVNPTFAPIVAKGTYFLLVGTIKAQFHSRLVAVDTLQTHLKIHTKSDLLACLVCGDKFAARTSLQLYLRKHTGERDCSVREAPLVFRLWTVL
jgi:hypothetical protein